MTGDSADQGQAVKHDDPTKRVLIPHESGTGTCYHAIGGCGGHLVTSTTATAEELVTGLGLRPCQSAACLNANIPDYDRCDGCAKPVFGAEPHADGVGRYCPACRAFLDEHPSPSHDQYELRRPSKLVPDGGVENHLGEAPNFEFDKGQCFKLAGVEEPEEYWYVLARVWNYDADTDDALVQIHAYKQYLVGEVSTLGGDERLVTEDTLMQQYETVDKETASEVLHS